MADILIKKSGDDTPVWRVFRVTEVKGRITQYELCLETSDFTRVAQMLIEW